MYENWSKQCQSSIQNWIKYTLKPSFNSIIPELILEITILSHEPMVDENFLHPRSWVLKNGLISFFGPRLESTSLHPWIQSTQYAFEFDLLLDHVIHIYSTFLKNVWLFSLLIVEDKDMYHVSEKKLFENDSSGLEKKNH